jgi:hypothetical protein
VIRYAQYLIIRNLAFKFSINNNLNINLLETTLLTDKSEPRDFHYANLILILVRR